jgi:hypothetical protein
MFEKMTRQNQVRVYKAVVTVLAVACIVGLLYGVRSASESTSEHLAEVTCNQAMLVFTLTGVKEMEKFAFCPPEVRQALQQKGIIP